MKFRTVVTILEDHGFVCVRQRGTHRTYRGVVDGRTQVVILAFSSLNEDVAAGTLGSITRQSALPKKAFKV